MTRPEVPVPLAAEVTDSHCHLGITRGDDDAIGVEEALHLAASVGVTRIVQIGCDLPSARQAVELAESHDRVVAGVAIHPNDVPPLAAEGALDDALAEIERLASSSSRVRAVGESGLDFFRTTESGHLAQEESFRAHIELAKRLDKALVIHDRDAHDDVLRVLADAGSPPRVVMHCFSGDAEFAKECVRRGYFLSFAGTVTFKNAAHLRDALSETPPEHLLVETDAPYLAPVPHRGKENSSYLIPLTIRCMAEVMRIEEDALCQVINSNTNRVFGDW